MDFQCVIEERPAQPTLCVKTHAPVSELPKVLSRAFGQIMAVMQEQGGHPAGAPYVAYRTMDMRDLDVEIGFPADHALAGRGEVVPSTLPGGEWASTMHVGPYDKVGPAWDELQRYLAAKHREPAGPGYEFYFDGPETPPEQIHTRVAFPLA